MGADRVQRTALRAAADAHAEHYGVLPLSMVDNSYSAFLCGKTIFWAGDGFTASGRAFLPHSFFWVHGTFLHTIAWYGLLMQKMTKCPQHA